MKPLLLILLTGALSGCFLWVDNGNGGLAEAWPVETESRHPLYQRNAQQLVESQYQLQQLAQQGALKVSPALMHKARMTWIRATREHSNRLDNAAHQQLVALNEAIQQLQAQLAEYTPVLEQRPGGMPL